MADAAVRRPQDPRLRRAGVQVLAEVCGILPGGVRRGQLLCAPPDLHAVYEPERKSPSEWDAAVV